MLLNVKTEHSFLQSLCKVDELISFASDNQTKVIGQVYDDFLVDPNKFILQCEKVNIKPIIGIRKQIIDLYNVKYINVYAKNSQGIYDINCLSDEINVKDIINDNLHIVFDAFELIDYKNVSDIENIEEVEKDIFSRIEAYGLKNYNFKYNEHLLSLLEGDSFIVNKMIYDSEVRFLRDEDIEYFIVLKSIANKNTYIKEKINRDKYKVFSYELVMRKLNTINEVILKNSKSFVSLIEKYNLKNEYSEVLGFAEFKDVDFEEKLVGKLRAYVRSESFMESEMLDYKARLDEEIAVIERMEFQNYFLIMENIIIYLKENNIKYGYGRGSAAGSLVSFLLGITKIDPIKYNLYFERFLNEKRASLPDIDLDIADDKRQSVINFLINKYGEDHTAKIYTLNRYLVKSAFMDVSKSLELDDRIIKKISSYLLSSKSFEENIQDNYKFFSKYDMDVKFDFLKESMKRIENLARNFSIHAAGVVISNVSLKKASYVHNNIVYSEAKSLETMGYIKFDILALSTLSFIDKLEKKVLEVDPKYVMDDIVLDKKEVYEALGEAKTLGIFQMESKGIRRVLQKYKPQSLIDIAIVIALYRPGPMQNIDLLVKNKENVNFIKYPHSNLKGILEQTYGIIVFQEQIMEIVKVVANFDNASADIFRVAISKKNIKAIEESKNSFLEGGLKNGYDKYTLEKLYENILKFAGYGFNKAHAISYARIIYQLMYIKVKYPTIFFSEMFRSNINSQNKDMFLLELYSTGVGILPPNIEALSEDNSLKRGKIILGLSNVKGLSKLAISTMIKLNEIEEYNGVEEFLQKVIIPLNLSDEEKLNLVGSGLFDIFKVNRKTVYETLRKYSKLDLEILKVIQENIKLQVTEDFTFKENSKIELNSLGFNLKYSSENLLKDKLYTKYKNAKLVNLIYDNEDLEINQEYFILGEIEGIKEVETKNNEKMVFLNMKKKYSEISIVVFPKEYVKYKNILEENIDNHVIFKLSKNKRGSFVFKDILV